MAVVISGKDLSQELKDAMKEEVSELSLKYGRVPHLAVVLVGNNPSSISYVTGKEKACEYVGIKNSTIKLSEDITEEELINVVNELNQDNGVDGILVQLPLPKHISEEKINEAIKPYKDIDGFNALSKTVPATPLGVYTYLKDMNFEFSGKSAVIIGRSNIVGRPMHKLLLDANMNVTVLHTKTSEEDKRFYLEHADLIVVAAGKAGVLNKSYKLKETAVVLDIGINFNSEGKLIGDCEPNLPVAFQSPVPGGCGLLTRLAVIENLILLSKNIIR